MAIKQVYKSKNFDKYLKGKPLTENGKKALFKGASRTNTVARQKHVPIATRATVNSMRMQVQDAGNTIELSSLNHKNVGRSGIDRYNYTKPNGDYKIRGKLIPANTNAGKFQWYDKAHAENEKKLLSEMEAARYD